MALVTTHRGVDKYTAVKISTIMTTVFILCTVPLEKSAVLVCAVFVVAVYLVYVVGVYIRDNMLNVILALTSCIIVVAFMVTVAGVSWMVGIGITRLSSRGVTPNCMRSSGLFCSIYNFVGISDLIDECYDTNKYECVMIGFFCGSLLCLLVGVCGVSCLWLAGCRRETITLLKDDGSFELKVER